MKRYVKTFEELLGSTDNEIPIEGAKKTKSKDELILDPDMQNPTAQGDDSETATARYPFGGL